VRNPPNDLPRLLVLDLERQKVVDVIHIEELISGRPFLVPCGG